MTLSCVNKGNACGCCAFSMESLALERTIKNPVCSGLGQGLHTCITLNYPHFLFTDRIMGECIPTTGSRMESYAERTDRKTKKDSCRV